MLFIFDQNNGLQIAWHGQGPKNSDKRSVLKKGFARLVRTRSAG
ncbi:hypothetical protein [Pseudohoeflea suaedae]|nr:hypothetical protein [Pseudohoeflea suaedae]